ncbi:cupin domain [Tamaricihabitans halophyticus]|uniref:Cupin domain n=1 Tax=Tamaricihabitans halophyticus TaxID=1262583 RepID=A0A4R2Q107_9PSEU|nr:cupin domain-containing protein [Tamaricihabitans halophyticus]TCP42049.1 cupin domain [Tamaricihabitans halophyticus]
MTEILDLSRTYLHLNESGAEQLPVDDQFWERVISGALPLPGWLVAVFEFPEADDGEQGDSEMHPLGDEVHLCLSGAMSAVLEYDTGTKVIDFAAGEACQVPRGTWHRLVARQPSRIVSFTFGTGTEHRAAG